MLYYRWQATAFAALGAAGLLAGTLVAGSRPQIQAPARSLKPLNDERPLGDQVARSPLFFEANVGQTDSNVRFLARSGGSVLFLTDTEAVVANRPDQPGARQSVLRMRPTGKARTVRPTSEAKQPGVSHYFVGRDQSKWQKNVPHFASVRYESVYPKIDLVYHGAQKRLEYDFVVAPGGKPEDIRVAFSGADSAQLDAAGALHLRLGESALTQPKPELYQEIDGVRKPVDGRFELKAQDAAAKTVEVAFRVEKYDLKQSLIIDPTLWYSTYLGGGSSDSCADIDVDATGRAIVTGKTNSVNFPSASPVQPNQPLEDAFITCYSATIDKTQPPTLLYSTYFGGSGADNGTGIQILGGNAVIVGTTGSNDLPMLTFNVGDTQVPKGFDNTFNGGIGEFPTDVFLARLSDNGGSLIYTTYLGGSGNDFGFGIAQDINVESTSNAVYITGKTDSTNFPLSQVRAQTNQPGTDVFVAKFLPGVPAVGAASRVYSTYVGGSNTDEGSAIAVNSLGEAFVTGATTSPNFPTVTTATLSPFQTYRAVSDVFLTRLRATGGGFVYSTFIGGTSAEGARGIAVARNNPDVAYLGGSTGSTDFPRRFAFDSYTTTVVFTNEAWVLALDTHVGGAQGLLFSSYLGGIQNDDIFDIALDDSGSVWVTGETTSTDFPLAAPLQSTKKGDLEAFVSQIVFLPGVEGQSLFLQFSSYLGGAARDVGNAIAIDSSNRPYLAGETSSVENPQIIGREGFLVRNAVQPLHAGGVSDGWVMKLGNTEETLDPSGRIAVTPKRLELGRVRAGAAKTVTLRIANRSDEVLTGHVGLLEAPFSLLNGGDAFEIPARGHHDVTVEFAPTEAAKAQATLAIVSSDPEKRVVNVPVKGKGRPAR